MPRERDRRAKTLERVPVVEPVPAPPDPDAPSEPARENLASAARRHGMETSDAGELLDAAGLYVRGRHNLTGPRSISFDPAEVDRVMAAHRAKREAAARVVPVEAPPVEPPLVAPYDGPCETCEATHDLSGGRTLVCRWCAAGGVPWEFGPVGTAGAGAPVVAPELSRKAERIRAGQRGAAAMHEKRRGVRVRCGRCDQPGHNTRTCNVTMRDALEALCG